MYKISTLYVQWQSHLEIVCLLMYTYILMHINAMVIYIYYYICAYSQYANSRFRPDIRLGLGYMHGVHTERFKATMMDHNSQSDGRADAIFTMAFVYPLYR